VPQSVSENDAQNSSRIEIGLWTGKLNQDHAERILPEVKSQLLIIGPEQIGSLKFAMNQFAL
jgi:hypothetical protein